MNSTSSSSLRSPASSLSCAIYTRKSTEEGLDQDFNSLDAQRESAEAYIKSQESEGWVCLPDRYNFRDDSLVLSASRGLRTS